MAPPTRLTYAKQSGLSSITDLKISFSDEKLQSFGVFSQVAADADQYHGKHTWASGALSWDLLSPRPRKSENHMHAHGSGSDQVPFDEYFEGV